MPLLGAGSDTSAIHVDVPGEIGTVAEKVVPVNADLLVIEDSAAGGAKKRVQVGNLPGGSGGTPRWLQSVFAEITTDQSSTSAVWQDLLSTTITTDVGSNLLIHTTAGFGCSNATNRLLALRVLVDGVPKRAVAETSGPIAYARSLALVYKQSSVSAGPHTVTIQWMVQSGFTIFCRPVTRPDFEHCSLLVEEVTS